MNSFELQSSENVTIESRGGKRFDLWLGSWGYVTVTRDQIEGLVDSLKKFGIVDDPDVLKTSLLEEIHNEEKTSESHPYVENLDD